MSKSIYLVVSSKRNTYPNRLAARGGMDREVKGTGKGGAKYCSSFSRPLLLLQGSSQKFRQLAYTSASGNAPGRALRTAHALFRPRPLRVYNVVLSRHSKITPVPHRSRRRFFVFCPRGVLLIRLRGGAPRPEKETQQILLQTKSGVLSKMYVQ